MEDLMKAAHNIRQRAHAPYSGFLVGAAIRGAGGGIFTGCNVENSAYPLAVCAEASAVCAMIAAGERSISEVVIVAGGEGLCSPCGGCRQILSEFAGPDVRVHLCGPEGLRKSCTLGELLPYAFSASNIR